MIHLAEDTINNDDVDSLVGWLQGYPRLTKGKETLKFEEQWAEWLGVKHAVYVNSGSSANLLMLAALEEKDHCARVVVPALSWATDLAPVMQLGMEPILCDCNRDDLSIDLDHLRRIFDEEIPNALMLVSVLGLVPQMDKIQDLCDEYGIYLLEDVCESTGSAYKDKKLGTYGMASTFSFYFGHHLSTIEGGMVCTDDDEYVDVLRSMRSHGWSREWDETKQRRMQKAYKIQPFNAPYTFYYPGFNLRATDLQAKIGQGQMEKVDSVVTRRNEIFKNYGELIPNNGWVHNEHEGAFTSNFAYPIIHPKRDKIAEALVKKGIETRPLICGSMGKQPFYMEKHGTAKMENAEWVSKCGLYIPNHPSLTDTDVALIADTVNKVIK